MNMNPDPENDGNAILALKVCVICWLVGIATFGTIAGIIIWIWRYL
jgi:hypothetical protein